MTLLNSSFSFAFGRAARALVVFAAVSAFSSTIIAAEGADNAERAAAAALPELRVEGRQLLTVDGEEVWLQGVNVVSLEFRLHGERVTEAIIAAIDEWNANAIRLPMKESYWFGREEGQDDGGAAYRKLVDEAIDLANDRGAYLVLDLHRFGAPRDEHVEFWRDAAKRYGNRPGILFDLFNETHSISWDVWRDGGWVDEREKTADEDTFLPEDEVAKGKQGFQSPGMQAMLDAVREAGARNVVIVGGLDWAYDLSGIVNGYALDDPSGNGIMYSTHIYNWKSDWEGKVMGAAALHPIFVGEVGADTKKMKFVSLERQEDPYTWVPDMLGLIQENRFHWTGWSFHPRTTPVLISDWEFTPTPFWGEQAKRALAGEQFQLKRMR